MAVADILKDIGQGVSRAGKAALPVLQRTAEVVSGEAPKIDEEDRQRAERLEDEQIATKAQALESNLAIGQKYGTLTPDQQQQYIDQITSLYSHPRHSKVLMEKLRKAIHPQGAVAMAPSAPPNALPPGGTAAADEANAEKLAAARYHAQPKKGFDQFLESWSSDRGLDSSGLTEAQLEDAHTAYYQSTHAPMIDKEMIQDSDSQTGYSVAEVDKRTGKVISKFQGVMPRPGFIPKLRVTKSKDQYGNETETVSEITPEIGKPGSAADASGRLMGAKPSVGGILRSKPTTGAKPAGALRQPVLPKTQGPPPLDANGHIPSTAGNPQIVNFANDLLDNRDAQNIPPKARASAESLARQYGWEQGALTPKEKILVNEAGTKLKQLAESPSLGVLDNTESRVKIAQVLSSSEKEGFIGRTIGAIMPGQLNPQEQEFIRLYNAAIGTITGLTPITRGGRPSESSVQRLIAEMPNVLQSGSSADAKQRIQQLLNEVQVATQTRGNTPIGGVGSALGGPNVIVVSPEDLK